LCSFGSKFVGNELKGVSSSIHPQTSQIMQLEGFKQWAVAGLCAYSQTQMFSYQISMQNTQSCREN
jgi:hypothetical protein